MALVSSMGRLESEHPSKNDQLPRKDVSYLITFTSTFHRMLAMRQQLHLVTPSSNSRLRPLGRAHESPESAQIIHESFRLGAFEKRPEQAYRINQSIRSGTLRERPE